jgi:ferrous iron transport protein A
MSTILDALGLSLFLKDQFITLVSQPCLYARISGAIEHIEMAFQDGKPKTLDQLALGQHAEVRAVNGHGPMSVRLLEMGFVPGVEVALIKRAPLGDPLELRLRGYHVSLRRAEARRVEIAP